jgi:antitoxin PrlF
LGVISVKIVGMKACVTISQHGVITIPARLRDAVGLKPEDELIIEATPEGLLIRPAVSVPIELYTDERIAEFTRDDKAITRTLARAPRPARRRGKSKP